MTEQHSILSKSDIDCLYRLYTSFHETRSQLEHRVSSKTKYKYLGQGSHSLVIEHPTDKNLVLKISNSDNDGFIDYINWLDKHSPIFDSITPEIHELQFTKFMNRKNLAIIIITRYRTIDAYLNEYVQGSNKTSLASFCDVLERYNRYLYNVGGNGRHSKPNPKEDRESYFLYFYLLRKLKESFELTEDCLDLGFKNLMRDDKNKVIVLDPLSRLKKKG